MHTNKPFIGHIESTLRENELVDLRSSTSVTPKKGSAKEGLDDFGLRVFIKAIRQQNHKTIRLVGLSFGGCCLIAFLRTRIIATSTHDALDLLLAMAGKNNSGEYCPEYELFVETPHF